VTLGRPMAMFVEDAFLNHSQIAFSIRAILKPIKDRVLLMQPFGTAQLSDM